MSYRKTFINHFEYLVSTYLLPIKLMMDTIEVNYKNPREYGDLGIYWVLLAFVVIDVLYWYLKEQQGQIKPLEIYKFSKIKMWFKAYGISFMLIALYNNFIFPFSIGSKLCLLVAFLMITKYSILNRSEQKKT